MCTGWPVPCDLPLSLGHRGLTTQTKPQVSLCQGPFITLSPFAHSCQEEHAIMVLPNDVGLFISVKMCCVAYSAPVPHAQVSAAGPFG